MSADERETLENKLIKEATDAVRLFYLSRQIVNDAKISISHQEVQNEAIATLRAQGAYQVPVDQIPKEVYALAVSKVMLAKAQDFVLSHAQETAIT